MSEHLGYDKPEKTPAQIAEQITRISHRLGDRALEAAVAHSSDGSADTTDRPTPDSSITHGMRIKGGERNYSSNAESIVLSKTQQVYMGGEPMKDGSMKRSVSIEASETDGTVSGTYQVYDQEGINHLAPRPAQELSNAQIVTASANTLGKVRGAVADAEQQKSEQVNKNIDEFVKS